MASLIRGCAHEAHKSLISSTLIPVWDPACDAELSSVGANLVAQHTMAETILRGKPGIVHRVTIAQPTLLLTLFHCAHTHCITESRQR